MRPSVITCKDVNKSLSGRKILNKFNIDIPSGSVYGILGKNGAGKTTLIKLIIGLLKPDAGQISVLGENPLNFSDQIKERFGYVPQKERLYPWLTVNEFINYTASFYRNWNKELINRLVNLWKIEHDQRISSMSEGEAQKVAIMAALGHEPELLVLDEPVASLDPSARRQFLKMILELVADRGVTIFFSTHITSDLERVADRVALLNEGSVTFSGEIEHLRETVKRVRIMDNEVDVNELAIDGMVNQQRTSNGIIFVVKGYDESLLLRLNGKYPGKVIIENLNLEEVFMELS